MPGSPSCCSKARPTIGGKLRTGVVGGVQVDVGAESMLARRPEAVGLAEELGLDLVHPASGSTQLWTRGALRPLPRTLLGVPLDLDQVAEAGVLSDEGLDRARHEEVVPLGDDDVSVAHLVGDRLGSEVVDRLVEPLLGGVYAGHATHLSSAATIPQVVSMLRTHGSLTAAAAAMPAAPASADAPMFAGMVGGLGLLPRAVVDAGGFEVRTHTTVRDLERTADGVPADPGLGPRPGDRRDRPGGARRTRPAGRPAARRRRAGGGRRARWAGVRLDGRRHAGRAGARGGRLVRLPGAVGGRPADQGVDVLLQQVGLARRGHRPPHPARLDRPAS